MFQVRGLPIIDWLEASRWQSPLGYFKKTPRLNFSRGNTWLEWLERGSIKLPFN